MLAVPGFVEMELLVKFVFFQEGKQSDPPAQQGPALRVANRCRRKLLVDIVVVVHGERQLLEMVFQNVGFTFLHHAKSRLSQEGPCRRGDELFRVDLDRESVRIDLRREKTGELIDK